MGCRCGGGAEHEHATDPDGHAARSLHSYIDFAASTVLNAARPCDLSRVLRAAFAAPAGTVESDADAQLIVKVQYAGAAMLGSAHVQVLGHGPHKGDRNPRGRRRVQSQRAPGVLAATIARSNGRRFANLPDLDFSSVDSTPCAQAWSLVAASKPVLYPTKIFKFSTVNHLTLFFPTNHGATRTTSLSFLSLHGDFSHVPAGEELPVICRCASAPSRGPTRRSPTWPTTGATQNGSTPPSQDCDSKASGSSPPAAIAAG